MNNDTVFKASILEYDRYEPCLGARSCQTTSSPRTPSPSSSSRLQTTPILESLRRTLSYSSLPATSTPKKDAPPPKDASAPLTVNLDDIEDEGEDAGNVTLNAAPPSPSPPPEDVSDSAHLSSDAAKKTRKKTTSSWFPERTEAQLAEWYQEQPIFYDRKRRDYKDSEKKKKLLEDKEKEINTTCKYILFTCFKKRAHNNFLSHGAFRS